MEQDKIQLQRFELKYIIPEEVALSARDFIRCYLDIDEYGALKPDLSYPVHSLYLDSDDLTLYQETINGNKNRYKLRLRYYDDRPNSPVFFEIKRRMNNIIMKQRGGVRRDGLDWILSGHLPDTEQLISKDPKQLVAIQNFCKYMTHMRAKPKAHVFYQREAWISRHDNSVRVTMDRRVLCEPDFSMNLLTTMTKPVLVFDKLVILELKFTNRFPDWFGELVRVYNLMQCGAAKYVDGVTLLGERFPHRANPLPPDEIASPGRFPKYLPARNRKPAERVLSALQ